MYEMEYPVPLDADASDEGMPMLIALQGYADAGQAIATSGSHLLDALDSSVVASFNLDELLDYRARRPSVTIDRNRITKSEKLSLDVRIVRDVNGEPFLLVAGPEPDLKWEAFAHAIVELAQRANVSRVISLYSAPMTVPHTRPLVVSAHASDPSLVRKYHTWDARLVIPGAAALETELQLSREGFDTIGLTAHAPHYIAASEYPEASYALLNAFSDLAGRELPLKALQKDMAKVQQQLAQQTEDSHEIATVVGALEHQYDKEVQRLRKAKNSLLEPGEDIPTGEELGAEFEAFLARMNEAQDNATSKDSPGSTDETTGTDPEGRADGDGEASSGDNGPEGPQDDGEGDNQ